ncbi:MAG TPA: DNA primase [Solirubrobacteraceae bacterium]|nr:DNA primase [Solirubrobacteraceae bacterium]
MSRYTADSRDRVLAAVDMVALISPRTELRRAGVDSYFGLCPFHDERSGSFHVRPEAKHYHCFGCQESGDPFSFVMQTEGLDFKGAMEALADRFGVQLETEDEDPGAAARRQRRERLHSLLDRVTTYYARYLWEAGEAQDARAYLLGRGLTEETLKEFRVGYAPSAWDRVLLASRRAGYSDEELLATGLAQRSQSRPGSIYDRFRGRVMFPAADARGRVHGFGARRMREEPDRPGAKYLNTSDGELYHKREVLFGIDLARAPAAKAARMILVEGYTDVLALHQAGIRNTVGIMGTSLTEEQIGELERVVKILELCLDADPAGQDAMLRSARLAAGRDLELRVVPLPEGTDPADLIERDGAEALRSLVQSSTPFVVFHVERILEGADTRSAEGRDRALSELRPVLNEMGASVLRDELVRRVAGRLELTEGRLATLLTSGGSAGGVLRSGRPGNGSGPGRTGGSDVTSGPGHAVRGERLFLALCLAVPDVGARLLADPDVEQILTSTHLRRAAGHLAGHLRAPLADLPDGDEEFARTISGLVELAGRVPDPSADRLEHARVILDLDRLERAIIRARAEGAGTSELARQREVVRDALREAVARLEKTL